jgi:hypothetical protein
MYGVCFSIFIAAAVLTGALGAIAEFFPTDTVAIVAGNSGTTIANWVPATSSGGGFHGISGDGYGMLYIGDATNGIRKIFLSNGTIAPVSVGMAISAVHGISMEANSNTSLLISSTNGKIYRLNVITSACTIVAGGTGGVDGGPATNAPLNSPWGVTALSDGSFYIADSTNNKVRLVTTAGIISTVAGTGTAGSTGDGSAATSATLNRSQSTQ